MIGGGETQCRGAVRRPWDDSGKQHIETGTVSGDGRDKNECVHKMECPRLRDLEEVGRGLRRDTVLG